MPQPRFVCKSRNLKRLAIASNINLKPGSYFLQMRMRREFDMNLTSQPSFCSIFVKSELSRVGLLQIICCEFVTSTFASHWQSV